VLVPPQPASHPRLLLASRGSEGRASMSSLPGPAHFMLHGCDQLARCCMALTEGSSGVRCVGGQHGEAQGTGMSAPSTSVFICSGAFHSVKPSDMLAELQGRLPIRVELRALEQQVSGVLEPGLGWAQLLSAAACWSGARRVSAPRDSGLQSAGVGGMLGSSGSRTAEASHRCPCARSDVLIAFCCCCWSCAGLVPHSDRSQQTNIIAQQQLLMATEGIDLQFTDAAVDAIAGTAAEVRQDPAQHRGKEAAHGTPLDYFTALGSLRHPLLPATATLCQLARRSLLGSWEHPRLLYSTSCHQEV